MAVTLPRASMDSTPSLILSSTTLKRFSRSSPGNVSTMRNSSRSGILLSTLKSAARSTASSHFYASIYTKALSVLRSTSMEEMENAWPASNEERSETTPTRSLKISSSLSFIPCRLRIQNYQPPPGGSGSARCRAKPVKHRFTGQTSLQSCSAPQALHAGYTVSRRPVHFFSNDSKGFRHTREGPYTAKSSPFFNAQRWVPYSKCHHSQE